MDAAKVERAVFRGLWLLTFPAAWLAWEFYRRGAGGWDG